MMMTSNNRPEEPLPGTVKLYEQHLLVVTRDSDWAPRIEQDGGFLQWLARRVARAQRRIQGQVKITAVTPFGNQAAPAAAGLDILLFPAAIRYHDVTRDEVQYLIDDHLIGGRVSERLKTSSLAGHHYLVCTHGARDERCGLCGPPLLRRLQQELALRERHDVQLYAASHVGGHAYAGNVVCYPHGDWFGYVTPDDIPTLLDSYLDAGIRVNSLWRGRMGMNPREQVALAAAWS